MGLVIDSKNDFLIVYEAESKLSPELLELLGRRRCRIRSIANNLHTISQTAFIRPNISSRYR